MSKGAKRIKLIRSTLNVADAWKGRDVCCAAVYVNACAECLTAAPPETGQTLPWQLKAAAACGIPLVSFSPAIDCLHRLTHELVSFFRADNFPAHAGGVTALALGHTSKVCSLAFAT